MIRQEDTAFSLLAEGGVSFLFQLTISEKVH